MLIKSLKDHKKATHKQTVTHVVALLRTKLDKQEMLGKQTHRTCPLSAGSFITQQGENSLDTKLSFIHRGFRLLSLCLCSSTGGAAPYSLAILKQPSSSATRLYRVSLMWDVAKLARKALGQCDSSAN